MDLKLFKPKGNDNLYEFKKKYQFILFEKNNNTLFLYPIIHDVIAREKYVIKDLGWICLGIIHPSSGSITTEGSFMTKSNLLSLSPGMFNLPNAYAVYFSDTPGLVLLKMQWAALPAVVYQQTERGKILIFYDSWVSEIRCATNLNFVGVLYDNKMRRGIKTSHVDKKDLLKKIFRKKKSVTVVENRGDRDFAYAIDL